MRKVLRFAAQDCRPSEEMVLAGEGMSGRAGTHPETLRLVAEAGELYDRLAVPVAVYADISQEEFGRVFVGEGRNAPDAVLGKIYPRAVRLALFACTVGKALTEEITRRFERHDYALGYVLDAVASAGVEKLAELVEAEYDSESRERKSGGKDSETVLRYSPGYCGWHVSGQRKLFEFLRPEEIGITLRESFLMEPLKSVSGVFVAGPAEIHRFQPATFAFCAECRQPSCTERLLELEQRTRR